MEICAEDFWDCLKDAAASTLRVKGSTKEGGKDSDNNSDVIVFPVTINRYKT